VVSVRAVTDEWDGVDCLVGRPLAGGVICWMLAAGLFMFGIAVTGTMSAGIAGALFAVASGSVVRMRPRARRVPAAVPVAAGVGDVRVDAA